MGLRALLAGAVLAAVMGSAAPAMARSSEHLTNYDRMLLERDGGASVGMNFSVRFGGDRSEERVPTWSLGLTRQTEARPRFDVLSYRFENDARIETPLQFRAAGERAWRPAFTMKANTERKRLIGLPVAEDEALAPAF